MLLSHSNVLNARPPQAVCDAATLRLRESGTSKIVLVMTIDGKGRVESFKTDSPEGGLPLKGHKTSVM